MKKYNMSTLDRAFELTAEPLIGLLIIGFLAKTLSLLAELWVL
ncbi:hypothetical protein [Oceaniferula flava]|nr:hypothetical protein [Oceaniferula flavus]